MDGEVRDKAISTQVVVEVEVWVELGKNCLDRVLLWPHLCKHYLLFLILRGAYIFGSSILYVWLQKRAFSSPSNCIFLKVTKSYRAIKLVYLFQISVSRIGLKCQNFENFEFLIPKKHKTFSFQEGSHHNRYQLVSPISTSCSAGGICNMLSQMPCPLHSLDRFQDKQGGSQSGEFHWGDSKQQILLNHPVL